MGAFVAKPASQTDLEKAYGGFAREAQDLDDDYAPATVNTDGWQATQNAWKALFNNFTVILCFLHEVSSTPSMTWIKIRDRAKKAFARLGQDVQSRVWEAYHATNKRTFSKRLRRLREWAAGALPESDMKKRLWICVINETNLARVMIIPWPIAPAIWWIG